MAIPISSTTDAPSEAATGGQRPPRQEARKTPWISPAIRGPRVLVIEDQGLDRRKIKAALSQLGFLVLEAVDGESGLVQFEAARPQVVILDLMLPGMDGFEVCARLRALSEDTAILMLTARGEDAYKIQGLDLGADDYMVKPFNPEELVARIRAILRRSRWKAKAGESLVYGPFRIEFRTQQAWRDGEELDLTQREFSLLVMLLRNPGRALAREEIHTVIWGDHHHVCAKALDVYIRRLREKIEDSASSPVFLKTVRGLGFLFE